MNNALGMIEYKTVSAGMKAADLMAKTAEIHFIEVSVICPGKYIALFSGELGAVKAAVDAVTSQYCESILDCFVIGNPHDSLIPALSNPRCTDRLVSRPNNVGGRSSMEYPDHVEALGIVETATAASAIQAGDICAKAAIVRLIEIRVARGMCGKSYVMLTGTIANVQEAVSIASANIGVEMLVDQAVIPRPDEGFWNMSMGM